MGKGRGLFPQDDPDACIVLEGSRIVKVPPLETSRRLPCREGGRSQSRHAGWSWMGLMNELLNELIHMSRALGDPREDLVIPGEGNTSVHS